MRLPDEAARAIAALERAGYETWAVGGCVRDSLLGDMPHDWDLCTAATPDEMKTVFAGERLLETGEKHGTLTLLTDFGPFEITTFRAEGAYTDGRRPDSVRFVQHVRDDLARRDFTVNAMAFHPSRGLCDPFGGRDDLKNGILRAVGDPDARFREDALRILRGLRFASKLGFAVETETAAAMRRQQDLLPHIAGERIHTELDGILCGRWVCRVLRVFYEVLGAALPEIRPMFGCAQRNPHHLYDVWEHSVRATGQVPDDPILRLSMLLHDCGKPACKTVDENGVGHFYGHPAAGREIAAQILHRLRCSNEEKAAVLLLVEQHDKPLGDSVKLVHRRLAQIGETHFRQLLAIKKGDAVGQGTHPEDVASLFATAQLLEDVLAADACFSLKQLAVHGGDLCKLGLAGPAVGELLHTLLDAVVDGQIPNEKDALLAFARTRMEETN